MKFRKTILILCAGTAVACSHSPSVAEHSETKEKPAASAENVASAKAMSNIEAKEVAAEERASFVTQISFRKGRAALTDQDRVKLKKILDQASRLGNIDDIKTVAWSDSEYPSVHTKTLPKADRHLADQRNSAIQNYLKSLNQDLKSKIKNYNMAERPSVFSEILKTPGAHLKAELETAGIPNTDTTVKQPSMASKAIVMVILKE